MKVYVAALLVVCFILVINDGYVYVSDDQSLSVAPSFLQGMYCITLTFIFLKLLFFKKQFHDINSYLTNFAIM